jgi:hypothetical protein
MKRVFPSVVLKHKRYGHIEGTLVAHAHGAYVVCLSKEMIEGERLYRKGWRIVCAESESTEVKITQPTQAEINTFYNRK